MDHEHYMKLALKEAQKAFDEGEVPIGAIVVINDKIISKAYNQVEKLNDSTAHAEIIVLTSAYNYLGTKYLPDATLYVTIEPCLMCAGALYWSKIGTIVYGAEDIKNGYRKYTTNEANLPFHPKTLIITGICKDESADLIKRFFAERR
jgi:tRNA(adenine34) deaminase